VSTFGFNKPDFTEVEKFLAALSIKPQRERAGNGLVREADQSHASYTPALSVRNVEPPTSEQLQVDG
jgi:hypothetical protein